MRDKRVMEGREAAGADTVTPAMMTWGERRRRRRSDGEGKG